jgi:hypothetical protein
VVRERLKEIAMGLKDLLPVPDGVRHAGSVIAALDRCFLVGFGRLGPEQTEALKSLERIAAGTPLGAPLSAAVEALGRNEFVDRHLAALAAARAALQGAQHDVLRAHAAQALGRPAPEKAEEAPAGAAVPEPVKVWQESTRHWLMEIALAGFGQLEYQTLAPFAATLEQLQAEPLMTRLAALLTGFQQELLRALPVSSLPVVPVHRWADLWTRAMVGALRPPVAPAGDKVSGTLSPLGLDLRQHGYFVSADVYALLEDGAARVVRVTLSSYKVDVVQGAEMWECFGKSAVPLLRALGRHEALKVKGATLLPTGDLLWDGEAKPGAAFSWAARSKKWLAPGVEQIPLLPAPAALDRHPVQIAEPVYLEGYEAREEDGWRLDFGDGARLDVATPRISGASEMRPEHLKGSEGLFGLLRFDGGAWSVQPLAVSRPGQIPPEAFTGSDACEPSKKTTPTLGVLRERAGKLLRKKS